METNFGPKSRNQPKAGLVQDTAQFKCASQSYAFQKSQKICIFFQQENTVEIQFEVCGY